MKIPFPEKRQYANNLTNGSREAIDIIDKLVKDNGGSIEHKTLEEIRSEVIPKLQKR